MPSCLRASHRSFTLLELMIVIVLVGVAATLIGLRLEGSTQQARLTAAAREIQQGLKLARIEARTRHRAVELLLEPDNSGYHVHNLSGGDGPGTFHPIGGAVIERAAPVNGGGAPAAPHALRVRISPVGFWLPFQVQLRSGTQFGIFTFDGVTGQFQRVDTPGASR